MPRPRTRLRSAPRAAASSERAPRVGFVSLGCPKALVDSERILSQLRAEGYEVSPTYEAADVVVVNTCGFIDAAVDESLDAIGEALEHNGRVIVTGCLGARPERILERHPRVLKVTGPHAYEDVVGAVHEHLPPRHDPFFDLLPPEGVRLTPRHYAYLKIAEGCNNKCSFCIIPSMRGRLASRRIDEVLREAERLVAAGVKELLVISQDTSAYGADLRYAPGAWRGASYQTRFIDLARGLAELGAWVRLHYVYPYPHVDEVIPLMAERRVLPYLDIPFQHGSASVLKRMRRPAHSENTLARIRAWRAQCPDLTLRSTFIVGFPGETDGEFAQLLAWLDEAELDRPSCRRSATRASWSGPRRSAGGAWRSESAGACACWWMRCRMAPRRRAAKRTRRRSMAWCGSKMPANCARATGPRCGSWARTTTISPAVSLRKACRGISRSARLCPSPPGPWTRRRRSHPRRKRSRPRSTST